MYLIVAIVIGVISWGITVIVTTLVNHFVRVKLDEFNVDGRIVLYVTDVVETLIFIGIAYLLGTYGHVYLNALLAEDNISVSVSELWYPFGIGFVIGKFCWFRLIL